HRLGDSNTIVDGLVRGVREEGLELAPLYYADANSGGLSTRETFEILLGRLLKSLRESLPVDGVLLSRHGAFAAQGIYDADGEILRAVRELVGSKCPILAVHDLHSNLSRLMADNALVLIVERTYPHVDMAERGRDAARLLAGTLRGDIRP